MIFRRKETATTPEPPADGDGSVAGKSPGNRGVSAHALRTPDLAAITMGQKKLSYSSLDARTSRLAFAMHRLGVREGDRVVSLLPSSMELFEVTVAAAKVDAMVVPLSPNFRPDHLATAVGDVCPALVVAHDGLWSELCSRTMELEFIKALLIIDMDGPRRCHFIPGVREEYEASLAAAGVRLDPWIASRCALLGIYHSSPAPGESGGLHLVLKTGEDVVRSQELQIERWSWSESDVYLLCGGAHHPGPGGWAQTALYVGARNVVMPAWDPVAWLATVEAEKVTRCFMNPRHFKSLLEVPADVWNRYDISSLRLVVHGGTKCPAAVKMRIIERLAPTEVWEIFGTVDTFVSRISSSEWLERPGSVGRPEPDVAVVIVDADGRPLPEGRTGMICWGPAPRHRPAAPQTSRVPPTSWSAYVGRVDEEGYLFVTDKSPDGVRRPNGIVYPWEVEEVIHGHRAVNDCVVFGAGIQGGKQHMVAVVHTASDALTVDALESHCRLYLPQEKCPDEIVLAGPVGRDDVGKISRLALANAYRHGSGIFAGSGVGENTSLASGDGLEESMAASLERSRIADVSRGPIAHLDGATVID